MDPIACMENMKKKYYDKNTKNHFFKQSQKIDCAKTLTESSEFHLETAIKNTVFILPDSNCVFLNYEIFKYFGHEGVYDTLVNYILSLILLSISKFEKFEFHINLNSFTISAAQRYQPAIRLFMNKCLSEKTEFSKLLKRMVIYNTPQLMNEISLFLKPLIDPMITDKITLYKREETPDEIKQFIPEIKTK
jgi:hypothetical protein